MSFAFDLISDLHGETWPEFVWTGQATSAYCVVAGDLARDRDIVLNMTFRSVLSGSVLH